LDEKIPAIKALDLGLITSVASDNIFDTAAHALAVRVGNMPIGTIGQVKRLMNQAFDQSLTQQLDAEREAIVITANSAEGREGVEAFIDKRKPQFVTL
jgi:2-(1,2-epoxy-1,2-dihydrophenyl)acetyl-CoA isomerase